MSPEELARRAFEAGQLIERERIAVAWDGCVHEAPGGDVDVGASIRAKHLVSVRSGEQDGHG